MDVMDAPTPLHPARTRPSRPVSRPVRSSPRSGHAVLNLVLILGLLSIGARFAWPAAMASWHLSQAEELVQMVRDIQGAVDEASRATGTPEADGATLADALQGAPLGETPESLASRLPASVTFQTPDHRLGWSWWSYGETLGRLIEGPGVGTLTVEIRDPGVRNAFLRLARESVWYVVDESVTFLVPVADGAS